VAGIASDVNASPNQCPVVMRQKVLIPSSSPVRHVGVTNASNRLLPNVLGRIR